jgi:hypothetical protein
MRCLHQSGVVVAQPDMLQDPRHSGTALDIALVATDRRLLSLADKLANSYGGPRVRSVVFITSNFGPEPRVIAEAPRWVCVMSRAQALAYNADPEWARFLIVETGPQLCASIAVRTNAGISVQETDAHSCSEVESLAHLFPIRHCLWASNGLADARPSAGLRTTLALSHRSSELAAVAGALEYATQQHQGAAGVWNHRDSTTLCANRPIKYSIFRSASPIFDLQNPILRNVLGNRPTMLVADQRVAGLYGQQWAAYATHHLNMVGDLRIAVSEHSKTWATVENICETAVCLGLPRNGVFAAIGGGITLDIVGLAAAIYRRGVNYLRIPTTLVGLCDAGVGIKQAVNACNKKNLLGAFYA